MNKRLVRRCSEPGCDVELPAPTGRGRPPTRCELHRRIRRHRKQNSLPARRLRVVPEPSDLPTDSPPAVLVDGGDDRTDAAAPDPPVASGSIAAGVAGVLAALDVGHPAGPALRAYLEQLAGLLDDPVTRLDRRVYVTVGKELRAALVDLLTDPTEGEGANDDDPWGFGDLRPTVGDASAS